MHPLPDFSAARAVSITVLVENRADLLLKSSETVKYFREKPLLAEHGFATLLDINHGEQRILWDSGATPISLIERMKT